MEQIGRDFTRGVLIEVGKWVVLSFGALFVITAALYWIGLGWDSTDDRAGHQHSNMKLRTDYGTGCQYLESRSGSLTPRLSADGKQVCAK